MRRDAWQYQATQKLSSVSDSARLEAELLLGHVLEVSRAHLMAYPEIILEHPQLTSLEQYLDQRLNGCPMAYILGTQEFYGLEFNVTQDTLIPRPETELLIDEVLAITPDEDQGAILDLGTGSGAIACTIAHYRPESQVTAVDFSASALTVAQQNGQLLGLTNLRWIESDWFDQVSGKFDLIVSNPPYIVEEDPHLESLVYEPISALTAPKQGMHDLETIATQARRHFKDTGGWLMMEHGYDQQQACIELLNSLGYTRVQDLNDLNNQPRLIKGFWNGHQ